MKSRLALVLILAAVLGMAEEPGPAETWPTIRALLEAAAGNDALLPEALREFEIWAALAAADPTLGPDVEAGWTLVATAFQTAGIRAETDTVARRDLISLAKLLWLAGLTKSRPRLVATGLALDDKARQLQDFTVKFTSEIEAPDRCFDWGRGRCRTEVEVRIDNGLPGATAPLSEEFTYPIPDDPRIVEKEIVIENDPEMTVTTFELRLSNASSEAFAPAGVSISPKVGLQFVWPEECMRFGLKGAGGGEVRFAGDPVRRVPLGFWASHFDELHEEELQGEELLVTSWETNPSGNPIATRTYSHGGDITETTTIEISFEPKR